MKKVFVCHRTVDKAQAELLTVELEADGHQVFLDSKSIKVGESIVGRINEALKQADVVLACFSAAGDSAWTEREWHSTLHGQLSGAPVVLVPVLLPGGTSPFIMSTVKYVDLSTDWAAGIAELLGALK